MSKRSPEFFLCSLLAWLVLTLLGCGTSPRNCGLACGTSSSPSPFLYATTTSNQILGFTISSTGTLTPVAPSAGPANSQSITDQYGVLLFADTWSNQAVEDSVDFDTGALTPVHGSPFTLGSTSGGPSGMVLGPTGENLYASEPNGTIVGYNLAGAAPLPGSPYAAGIAPTQMAFAFLGNSGAALYASEPGDSKGGILAFSVASDGSLSPIAGSPFATAPNAGPSYLLGTVNSTGSQFLFVSLSSAGQIAGFRIDSTTGALTPIPASPFVAGKGPGTLVQGPANELFVINTVDHTVEAFNIASNGILAPVGSPVAVGTASGGMVFHQAQFYGQLFIADTAASSIELVNMNPSSGAISAGGTFSVSRAPLQLAVYDLFPLP